MSHRKPHEDGTVVQWSALSPHSNKVPGFESQPFCARIGSSPSTPHDPNEW